MCGWTLTDTDISEHWKSIWAVFRLCWREYNCVKTITKFYLPVSDNVHYESMNQRTNKRAKKNT